MNTNIAVLQAMADAIQAEIDKAGSSAPQNLLDRIQALDEQIASEKADNARKELSDKFNRGKDPKTWPGM